VTLTARSADAIAQMTLHLVSAFTVFLEDFWPPGRLDDALPPVTLMDIHMSLYSRLRRRFINRSRGSQSRAIALASSLVKRASVALVGILGVAALIFVSPQANAPRPADQPGSGIVVRTEVTVLWIPRVLLDFAQGEAGRPTLRPPEVLRSELTRRGMNDAWYALTYRGYNASGKFGEVTQIRRLSDAAAHLNELQAVMATAAGNSTRSNALDFLHTRVEIIPDALQAVDPRDAITGLISNALVTDTKSPTPALDPGLPHQSAIRKKIE
jgi:hypothetical protein